MTILDFAGTASCVSAPDGAFAAIPPGVAVIALSDELWRVTRSTGEVLGYIETLGHGFDRRFLAKRVVSNPNRSLSLGEFWRADDAIGCFRL